MENASKALLMAAGVLIGILILSLAVYLFATFGSSSAQMHKQIEADRLNEFNTQFTSYEGKEDITIYDVITVTNLAKENNKYYQLNEQTNNNFYINVSISSSEQNIEKKDNNEIEQLIKSDTEINNMIDDVDENGNRYKKLSTYKCKVEINSKTGRVYKVTFTKNRNI
ncbi:MAG: hypothetical protein HFJ40_05080 [Clostridia bacterium]|nr:hypothetical protein [Clostridia bacterium]